MPKTTYPCKGCGARTRCRNRVCPTCAYEVSTGLYGGRWIPVRGVQVWVKDEVAA